MKAIILAAGQGTRLKPLTDDRPKCLVQYQGKPILEHTLAALQRVGISDITVVRGYQGSCLDAYDLNLVTNPEYAHTNMVHSLFCAEKLLVGDLLVIYGDIVFADSVLAAVIAAPASTEIAVVVDRNWKSLWAQRMEDPLADAETLKIRDGKIIELGKKPKSYADIEGQYIGMFRISGDVLPEIIKFYHSLDRSALYQGRPFEQMFMTTFLQLVADRLFPLTPAWIEGGWVEIDAATDLQIPLN